VVARPSAPPAEEVGTPGNGGWAGERALTIYVIAISILVLAVIVTKLFDLKWERERQAAGLMVGVSDALGLEDTFLAKAITPMVHIPLRRGKPITVEVTGLVPSLHLRETTLRIVRTETSRLNREVRIDDRIHVAESGAPRVSS